MHKPRISLAQASTFRIVHLHIFTPSGMVQIRKKRPCEPPCYIFVFEHLSNRLSMSHQCYPFVTFRFCRSSPFIHPHFPSNSHISTILRLSTSPLTFSTFRFAPLKIMRDDFKKGMEEKSKEYVDRMNNIIEYLSLTS